MVRFPLLSPGPSRLGRPMPFFALALATLTMLFAGSAASAFAQSLSGFIYNGQVYTSYQANEYLETPQGPDGTAAIRATGATYGSVVATQYVQTYTSNTIAPETASTPGYNSSSDPLSPTDAAVAAAIHNLQAQGITVVLKPHVDSLDGSFRGNLAPTSVADWFASYQTFILHYAQIASENNVGNLVIGTELASLSKAAYRSYWLNIIAQIRSSFPNLTLIYGANATYASDEFTTVSFWDKVDIMGVDGYFPLTNHADPTVAQLVAAWTDNVQGLDIVTALHNVQSQFNKPMIFTELGYVSAPGTNEAPYNNAAAGAAYDPTEQENCYEAFFEVFSQQTSWMKGVFWWAWNVSPPGPSDTGYTPQDKPAADTTLVKWYSSTTEGFTLAPSTSILTLGQGLQVPATIAVTNLGGFSGNILLSATGLPSGVTASFTPGTGTGTQVMTLTASSSATAGPATITITGTSGSLMATTSIALTVQGATAQTITFANPGAQTVGTPLTLSATASSGLAVSFASSTLNVCTVTGSTATFSAAGTCTITASQAGNSVYSAAPPVSESFAVSTLATVPVPASADVIVSQVNWLSPLYGNASTSGNPAGGSFATNSQHQIVDANTNNLLLFDEVTGAITTLGAWSNAGAVAVDAQDNIYVGNLYGPVNSIIKLPYTGASTNAGYAAFTTPTSSTPACTGASTAECALPIPGSVNPSAMTFDASGDLFWATGGNGATSGNAIYKCAAACLAGTASPVLVYQEPTAQTAPSASSGQLLVGGIAIDPTGNLFFTDSSIYVDPSYAITSFFSNLNELPVSQGAGYGGAITGFAATPSVLYTVTPASVGTYDNQLDAVAINPTTGTVYFADISDGIFAFPNTGSAIPTANGQPTALYTVSKQGAKTLTTDAQGNLDFIVYASVFASGDTVGKVTLDAVSVPASPVGTAVSPSSTLNPVTTILNDTLCSATPAPSVTFSGTSPTAAATAATTGTCSSTLAGGAAFATNVSFTPSAGGTDSVSLTATDQASNTGTVTVTGVGQATLIAQTITFAAPPAQTVGTTLTLTATASSGLAVTFTSATTAVCTITNNVASFLTAGTCTIDANQPGDAQYSPAPQVQESFTVNPAPSFTLVPAASALTVVQGTSGTDTITVTGANGFGAPVTLAATGLPAGVTASFATNPATGTSVLTLTATGTANTGAAMVTVTGTSGSLTASTTIALTIAPAPSFTLAPSTATLSVTQGSTATDTITIAGANGFTGSVTLAASGLPAGVTASFSTNPATASTVLTLTASSAATTGTATVTITGTSGSLAASTTIALTVNVAPGITLAPSTPTVSVAPGATATDTISLSGSGGFVGSVTLTAAITSSPSAAQDPPTLSFGATSPLNVTSTGATATLTIMTTAATTAALTHPAHRSLFLEIGGGGALACVLLFGIPARRRRWPILFATLAVLLALTGGTIGCGGSGGSSSSQPTGNPGTTPGTYTITVTATGSATTGGTATATLPVTLTVQ